MKCETSRVMPENTSFSVHPAHENPQEEFELSDVEMETLRRAALERHLPFDKNRRNYLKSELILYGMVREAYTRDELTRVGFGPGAVSCFDDCAKKAEEILIVDTPFGNGIKKWQLPINTKQMRIVQTFFPPNTVVESHVHPENGPDDSGGGLRIVTRGKIFYKGQEYGPGNWFFIPNGVPYSFTTDPDGPTIAMYKYAFFGDDRENRFSHPSSK